MVQSEGQFTGHLQQKTSTNALGVLLPLPKPLSKTLRCSVALTSLTSKLTFTLHHARGTSKSPRFDVATCVLVPVVLITAGITSHLSIFLLFLLLPSLLPSLCTMP